MELEDISWLHLVTSGRMDGPTVIQHDFIQKLLQTVFKQQQQEESSKIHRASLWHSEPPEQNLGSVEWPPLWIMRMIQVRTNIPGGTVVTPLRPVTFAKQNSFQLYMYNYHLVLDWTIAQAKGGQVNLNRLACKNEVSTIHIAASFTHNNNWKNKYNNPSLETWQ